MDIYYSTEKPLPLDLGAVCRLARAKSKGECAAVETVIREFFTENESGWHQHRCDDEIAAFAEKSEKARESAAMRWSGKRNANALRTHCEGNAPNNQEPRTSTQEPVPSTQKPGTSKPTKVKNASAGAAPTAAAWMAYSGAYRLRYGVEPVRNEKVNAQLFLLIKRLPADEVPEVIEFYVLSNRALYVSAKHCVELLLRDAEGLRTEWATGRSVTDTEARQADRTQANGNVWGTLIEEARNEGH